MDLDALCSERWHTLSIAITHAADHLLLIEPNQNQKKIKIPYYFYQPFFLFLLYLSFTCSLTSKTKFGRKVWEVRKTENAIRIKCGVSRRSFILYRHFAHREDFCYYPSDNLARLDSGLNLCHRPTSAIRHRAQCALQSCICILSNERIWKSTPDRKYLLSAVSHHTFTA